MEQKIRPPDIQQAVNECGGNVIRAYELSGDPSFLYRAYAYLPLDFVQNVIPWEDPAYMFKKSETPIILSTWQYKYLKRLQDEVQQQMRTRGQVGRKDILRYALKSGHGVGKSWMIAMVVCWAMLCLDGSEIVVTANTKDQLRHRTWKAIMDFLETLVDAPRLLDIKATAIRQRREYYKHAGTCVAQPWDQSNPDSFQGAHGQFTFMIFDEASAFPSAIWDAAQGAMSSGVLNFFIAMGNPTTRDNRFGEIFHEPQYESIWHRTTIRAMPEDCPHISQQSVDDLKLMHGEDSDEFRVRVLGEFPHADSGTFYGADLLHSAFSNPKPFGLTGYEDYIQRPGGVLGVDIAGSGKNQTVMCYRHHEDGAFEPIVIKETNTRLVSARIAEYYRLFKACVVFVDNNGAGLGVYDDLRLMPDIHVIGVMNKSQADQPLIYASKRSEIFDRLKDWLPVAKFRGNCREYRQGLAQVRYVITGDTKGRLQLVPKMQFENTDYNDYADALALTFADRDPFRYSVERMDIAKQTKPKRGQKVGRHAQSWMSG